ncbi:MULTISPECIES: AMP-binding protein [unclassified Prochlorococcus]|uniref:AMP-binding protein n=1 Tax=unclassified Prochlorococcus TaxID=2627481 RepID=UPI000A714B47|nr:MULTISPECIES: AMP-binding protein [unclassified Prochlorococcus]
MDLLSRTKELRPGSSQKLAHSFWIPTKREQKALDAHRYVRHLDRVDQIWPWLKQKHGKILAVNAPHVACPESYTYEQLANKIAIAASSFNSLGILYGDVVALFSENSPRWLILDQGLMRVGASNAVRGSSAPVEELRYILDDSRSAGLIVQSAQLWEDLGLSEEQKEKYKFVLQMEGEPLDGLLGWEEFLSIGANDPHIGSFGDMASTSSKNAIATIIYTSGTTGKPKGVPLTHANLLHQISSLACIASPAPGTPLLSVLPIWHSYERSAEYYFFSCACSQYYTTIKHLREDLQVVKPVVMATVPRLWEGIKTGFDDALKKMPRSRQLILKAALLNSRSFKSSLRKTRDLLLRKVSLPERIIAFGKVIVHWPLHMISAVFLWPKVLKQLSGGRLLFPINGGGAIAPHVDEFFESLGVELLVGYGLTETSPVVSCRRTWRNIRGSSGLPLPHTEFRIVDPDNGKRMKFLEQGKVLVRGPQVMNEYLRKPDASSKVLDREGWFDTGDIGMLLKDGSIVLTGRAKDTIVLSSGENIEPGPLEELLVASPLIDQLMMVGQDERQLGALLVPNVGNILIWAKERDVFLNEDLGGPLGDLRLRKLLQREINQLLSQRRGSRPNEKVLGVALVKPFSIENGLLTQTLKQRRDKIVERDSKAIKVIFGR